MKRFLAAAVILMMIGGCRAAPAREEKPTLLFLSSLPLLFSEDFSLQPPTSPLREALERRFSLQPIALADMQSLGSPNGLLLMAQPRAQTAEALVDLDRWIRNGGRVLLLADPYLEWPTAKGLGDPTGPMLAFADTGLLKHWGLVLYRPDEGQTTGTFELLPNSPCRLDAGHAVARCTLGKGLATIIADADFARDEAGAERIVAELEKLRKITLQRQFPTNLSTGASH